MFVDTINCVSSVQAYMLVLHVCATVPMQGWQLKTKYMCTYVERKKLLSFYIRAHVLSLSFKLPIKTLVAKQLPTKHSTMFCMDLYTCTCTCLHSVYCIPSIIEQLLHSS